MGLKLVAVMESKLDKSQITTGGSDGIITGGSSSNKTQLAGVGSKLVAVVASKLSINRGGIITGGSGGIKT